MKKAFGGKSNNGDFNEALHCAIQAAKDGLKTDYITWELKTTRGENGGFVQVDNLTVTILATPPD